MSNVFGWNYPPGCSGPPEDDVYMSALQEDIWGILEKAGMPDELIEKIDTIIYDWQTAKLRNEDINYDMGDINYDMGEVNP